mmetsp:Transcript_12394/g.13952  ORF Transcript_12394/g.13952 Transcript_12394/m.13952 type:complete len:470 (+) Transcript_12394:137-1546(+)
MSLRENNNDNDNDNDNNNDHHQHHQYERVINNVGLIQDLDHYVERNGLLNSDDNDNQEFTLGQSELAARLHEEEEYKNNILGEFLKKDGKFDDDGIQYYEYDNEGKGKGKGYAMNQPRHKMRKHFEKQQILKLCRGKTISIETAQETIHDVSLMDMVEKCQTMYTFVHSNYYWSSSSSLSAEKTEGTTATSTFKSSVMPQKNESKNDDNDKLKKSTTTKKAAETETTPSFNIQKFLLKQFDQNSVQELISVIQGIQTVQEIKSEDIIECCYIAHFLQADTILDEIVDIIKSSIDSSNCASICILADELTIPALFSSSMEYVMDTLDKIQSNNIWSDFPESLQHHIITLRNAAHSSIVGRGHQSKVIFTSKNEFLGIFFDTLREHKERLHEAKRRQQEIIEERMQLNVNTGRYVKEKDVYGGSVKDAAIKIEKQERRVKTLEVFYKEQKAIFSKDAKKGGNSVYRSKFSL